MAEKRKSPTQQERRNAEAARLALQERNAKRRRIANAKANAERRALMRQINTFGTMRGPQAEIRAQIIEGKYQRMVAKVMRQATYTPSDFKQLGRIVRSRLNRKWTEVDRLIDEWVDTMKRRACRIKKDEMRRLAQGLNIEVGAKNTRKTICSKIKNKM